MKKVYLLILKTFHLFRDPEKNMISTLESLFFFIFFVVELKRIKPTFNHLSIQDHFILHKLSRQKNERDLIVKSLQIFDKGNLSQSRAREAYLICYG
jgi:hypothetical protein